MKSRSVRLHRVDGAVYRWRNDCVTRADEPGRNLAEPRSRDPLHHEVAAFHAAVTGVCPRMVDDSRFSIGIATPLRDVGCSLGGFE